MKFALASLLIGSAAAFSASPSAGYSTALRSTVTETYTFTKSEEIFAEAKNVSFIMLQKQNHLHREVVEKMLQSCSDRDAMI